MSGILVDKGLTRQDRLVLQNLAADVRDYRRRRRNEGQKQPGKGKLGRNQLYSKASGGAARA